MLFGRKQGNTRVLHLPGKMGSSYIQEMKHQSALIVTTKVGADTNAKQSASFQNKNGSDLLQRSLN